MYTWECGRKLHLLISWLCLSLQVLKLSWHPWFLHPWDLWALRLALVGVSILEALGEPAGGWSLSGLGLNIRAVLGVRALLLRGVPGGDLGDLDLDAGLNWEGGESPLSTELAEMLEDTDDALPLGRGKVMHPPGGRLDFQLKIGSLVWRHLTRSTFLEIEKKGLAIFRKQK